MAHQRSNTYEAELTASKRAEESLHESEERYRALLASAPMAVFVCDRDAVIQHYNRHAVDLWGREPVCQVERHCGSVKLWLPDGTLLPHAQSPIVEVLRTGTSTLNVEVLVERPDGSRLPVLVNFAALKNVQGETTGGITSFMDISERKRAEEAVRQSAGQYETLLTRAPIGVFVVNADFRLQQVNPVARKVFGEISDLIGRDFDEVMRILWAKEDADEIVRLFHHTLETGEAYVTPEFTERRLDRGITEHYEWQIDRIPLIDGRFGVVCYFQDISRQVLGRAAIVQSEERLRFMAESMPQKVFTARPSGEVDYFNPQWAEFTGLSFEQIREWGWTQFIHPDDVADNVRVWQRSIDSGVPFHFEHRFRRADGEYRWHLSRAEPFRNAEGSIVMWIGSNTDIHEQRQTANHLRRLAADLSEADRRKNEFLAMLAHELRNPLAPISNALQIMQRKSDDQEVVRAAAEMMERQIGQMTRLVDDLLDLSRITRGKIELRKEQVDLTSLVDQAIEAARSHFQCMNHRLTTALPREPLYVTADPLRLAQIVGNLLNNACKFTDKDGVVSLSVEQEDAQAVIRVRDNGIGIAADHLLRIFDLFVQIDTTLERSAGGLGIGLTLVKKLVEMHDGTVEAHSAGVARGSEFVVRLPVFVERRVKPRAEPYVGELTTTARRILIVDDNRDAAESLAMLLQLTGHETHIAYDGLEAVMAAEAFKPDVALLDIGLPTLNGYEVARKIRERSWGEGMLLIALTGWGQDGDRQKSTEAGFDAHLVKPAELGVLQKLLETSQTG